MEAELHSIDPVSCKGPECQGIRGPLGIDRVPEKHLLPGAMALLGAATVKKLALEFRPALRPLTNRRSAFRERRFFFTRL